MAPAWVFPASTGTAFASAPRLTFTFMVCPGFTIVSSTGDWLIMVPAGSSLISSSSISALSSKSLRYTRASLYVMPIR